MKNAFVNIVTIFSVALILQPGSCRAEEDDTAKINRLIAHYVKQLNVGTVPLNWSEQPEVKRVRAFPDIKRTAAILATIWDLGKNYEEIYSRMKTNDYQVLVSMLTRIRAYTFLANLTGGSANDVVLKDYLDPVVSG